MVKTSIPTSSSTKQVFKSPRAALKQVDKVARISEEEIFAPQNRLHIISVSKVPGEDAQVTMAIPTLGIEERVSGDVLSVGLQAKEDFDKFLTNKEIDPIDVDVRSAVRPRYHRDWVFLNSDYALPQVTMHVAVERWSDSWRIMGTHTPGWGFGADYSAQTVEYESIFDLREQVIEDFYAAERRIAVLPVPNIVFWVPVVNNDNEAGYFRATLSELKDDSVYAWLGDIAEDEGNVVEASDHIPAELVDLFDEPTDLASLRKNLAALAEDAQHEAFEMAFRDHITEGVNLEDQTLRRLGVPHLKFRDRV